MSDHLLENNLFLNKRTTRYKKRLVFLRFLRQIQFCRQIIMQKGYGQHRRVMLPPLSSLIYSNDEKEKQLMNQMQKIDQILKTDNLTSLHGLIFTNQLKNRVSQDLLACIKKQHRLVSYGFEVWSQNKDKAKQRQGSQSSFQKKLEEMSAFNISKFDQKKNKQGQRIDWKVTLNKHYQSHKKRTVTHTSTNKMSHISTNEDSIHSVAITPQNSKSRVKNKLITQPQQQQQFQLKQELTIQKIQRMLSKVSSNLITIWLPPKSYPQFYGLLVPSLATTGKSELRCRIKKYILFKQSLSSRLFEAILDYLSSVHEIYIDRIEMIVNRQDYRSYFQQIGFKIESWEGVEKISISYSRR